MSRVGGASSIHSGVVDTVTKKSWNASKYLNKIYGHILSDSCELFVCTCKCLAAWNGANFVVVAAAVFANVARKKCDLIVANNRNRKRAVVAINFLDKLCSGVPTEKIDSLINQ